MIENAFGKKLMHAKVCFDEMVHRWAQASSEFALMTQNYIFGRGYSKEPQKDLI